MEDKNIQPKEDNSEINQNVLSELFNKHYILKAFDGMSDDFTYQLINNLFSSELKQTSDVFGKIDDRSREIRKLPFDVEYYTADDISNRLVVWKKVIDKANNDVDFANYMVDFGIAFLPSVLGLIGKVGKRVIVSGSKIVVQNGLDWGITSGNILAGSALDFSHYAYPMTELEFHDIGVKAFGIDLPKIVMRGMDSDGILAYIREKTDPERQQKEDYKQSYEPTVVEGDVFADFFNSHGEGPHTERYELNPFTDEIVGYNEYLEQWLNYEREEKRKKEELKKESITGIATTPSSFGSWVSTVASNVGSWFSTFNAERTKYYNGGYPFYGVGYPHYANGFSYVPYDNFPALLHEGERVLTASENRAYNNQSSASVVVSGNNFTIREEADVDKVAKALVRQMSRAYAIAG